jgi:hypothetical protein
MSTSSSPEPSALRPGRFVARQEFADASDDAAAPSIGAFRADQDAAFGHDADSPYDRETPPADTAQDGPA